MTETKICQKCQQSFVIATNDLDFYSKIKVPPPTWCPGCRLIRQISWRNERCLYERKCDATGKNIISVYSPDKPFKVYDQKYWWSDNWNPMDYGKEYDFSKSFFLQFEDLLKKVPWPNLANRNPVNSDYCNITLDLKNCYLVFAAGCSENTCFANQIDYIKDSMEVAHSANDELCYEVFFCYESYKLFFSAFSKRCLESNFLWDCEGCSFCFGCVGLRNKSYYIFNQPYSKEEYLKKINERNLGSFQTLLALKNDFFEFRLKFPYKYARIKNSVNATGDNLQNAKNVRNCFDAIANETKDSKYLYLMFGNPVEQSQSSFEIGGSIFVYDSVSLTEDNSVFFSKKIWIGYDVRYSYNCHSSSHLFACIGLRSKQYCILNKQYTKEEYEELVPKIIEQMNNLPFVDQQGRTYKYGEFFPPELSPFCYNETIAQEYFPLIKEQAISQGFSWKDPEPRNYQPDVYPDELPDHIKDVKDDIIGKVISCSNYQTSRNEPKKPDNLSTSETLCTEAFKIIESELQFYRRMNLPLPRLCPNCRHYQRIKQRNPLRLWHRKCMCQGSKSEVQSTKSETLPANIYENTIRHFHGDNPCPNEFETSYAPERKEIVYCEQCYLAEVV